MGALRTLEYENVDGELIETDTSIVMECQSCLERLSNGAKDLTKGHLLGTLMEGPYLDIHCEVKGSLTSYYDYCKKKFQGCRSRKLVWKTIKPTGVLVRRLLISQVNCFGYSYHLRFKAKQRFIFFYNS